MVSDGSRAGRQPVDPAPRQLRPDDTSLATRVQAAWDINFTGPDNASVDRLMAVIAVRTVLIALDEGGHLV